MYVNILPDDVLIPDIMVRHVESGVLGEEARRDIHTWAETNRDLDPQIRGYWLTYLRRNVIACRTYGVPDCAEIFSYMCEVVERVW